MSTIADLEIIVTSDTGDAEAGLDSVNNKLDSNVVKQGLVGAGMVALSKQGFGFLSGALMDASDFESALTDAYIALGDFEGGMDGLQEVIMDLGEALPFSATEVANLVEELGKLGIAADDIQAVAYSVMSLAAGLGTDLVPTGQAVIKIMNSLGMSMENVDELTNQLFKVLAAGTLDLSSFMEAWKNVGALVKQAGMSFVDAAGFITLLTDAGINASTAGNALARLFSALLKPSEELKAMLNSLNIEFENLSVKDIILNIMDAWDRLSTAQKLDLAELIGGKEYMAELMTLFDQGREKFQEFMEKYNAAMDLQDVIKTKMGTAKAMWDTFTETLGNVKIMIGQQLLPAFKSFLTFITPLIDAFKNIPGPILKVVTIVGVLATAFIGLAGAVGVIMASGALGGFGVMLGLMLNPITLLVAGLGFLGAKFLMTGDNMEKVKNIISTLVYNFQQFTHAGVDPVTAALYSLGVVFPQLRGAIQATLSVIEFLKSAFSSAVGVVQTVAASIGGFIVDLLKMGAVRDVLAGVVAGFLAFKGIMGVISVFNAIKTAIMGVRVAMIALNASLLANPFVLIAAVIIGLGVALFLLYKRFEGVRKVVDPVLDVLKALGKWVGGKLLSGFKSLMSGIQKVVGFFQNLQRNSDMAMAALNVLGSIVGGVLVGAFNKIISIGRSFGSWVGNLVSNIASAIKGFASWVSSLDVVQGALNAAGNVVSAFSGFLSGLWGVVTSGGNVFANLSGWLADLTSGVPAVSAVFSALEKVWTSLGDAFSALKSGDISGFFSGIGTAVQGMVQLVGAQMLMVPRLILQAFTSIDWGSVGSALLSGLQSAISFIGEVGGWLTDKGTQLINGLKSGIDSAWETVKTWFGNLGTWAKEAIPELLDTLKEKGTALINGIKNGAVEAWGLFTTWLSQIAGKAVDFIGEVGTTLKEKGTALINGLKNGANEAWGVFTTWLGTLASKVLDFIGNVETTLKEKGTALIQGLKNGAVEAWNTFTTWIGQIPSKVADYIGNPLNTLKEKGVAIVDGLKAGMQEGWNNFTGWLDGAINGAIDKLNGLIEGINSLYSWTGAPSIPLIPKIGEDADKSKGSVDLLGDAVAGLSKNSITNTLGLADVERQARKSEQAIKASRGEMDALNNLMSGAIMRDPRGEGQVNGNYSNPYNPTEGGSGIDFTPIDTSQGSFGSSGAGLFASITSSAKEAQVAIQGANTTFAQTPSVVTPMVATNNQLGLSYTTLGTQANTGKVALSGALLGISTSLLNVLPSFNTFSTVGSSSFTGIQNAASTQFTAMKNAVVNNTLSAALSAGTNSANMSRNVIANALSMATQSKSHAESANKGVTASMLGMQIAAVAKVAAMKVSILAHMAGIVSAITTAGNSIKTAMQTAMQGATAAISGHVSNWAGIVSAAGGGMRAAGFAVGAAAGQGVAAGLYAALGAVSAAANAIIAEVDRAMRAKARIHSPSRMTREIAEYMGEGIVDGLNDSIRPIVRAAGSVVDGIEGALSPRQRLVQDLTNTVAGVVTDSLTDTLSSVLATTRPTMGLEMQSGNRAALAANTYNTTNTTYYITNHYTVNVDDLEDLNEAVEFVRDLPRERELIAI